MTVLITGGSGFVGLNVAAVLLARGDHVVLFDLNGPPANAERHLRSLPGKLDIEIGDVRSGEQVSRAMERYRPKRLVHGAAITASVERERTQSNLIVEVNLGGTINVLEAALAHGIGRVVQFGTGSVYGSLTPAVEFLDENVPPVPETVYGITKYAAERTALRYRNTRGLDVVVGRLGVTFGRWEYDTGVRDTLSVPLQLLKVAGAGGKASFRRNLPDDWVYATDVAEAAAGLLDAPSLPHSLYHIGGGKRWSVPAWCDQLKKHFPGFGYTVVEDGAEVNVGAVQAGRRPPFSIARLQKDIGYSPRFDETHAFADYMQWHRDHSGAAR